MKRLTRTKRLIALGDIHGEIKLLKDLIQNQIRFNPGTDLLAILGDFIDRSSNSKEVVEFLKRLKEEHPEQIVLLKGNHEDMAYCALTKAKDSPYLGDPMATWLMNGGQATIDSFGGVQEAREILVPFIEGLELYLETESHIFLHGGIPRGKSLKTATPLELLWDRDLSYAGKKTLVVGHTPHGEVTKIGNIVCVDSGAFMTGKLSAYDCLSGKIYEAIEKDKREISLRLLRRRG